MVVLIILIKFKCNIDSCTSFRQQYTNRRGKSLDLGKCFTRFFDCFVTTVIKIRNLVDTIEVLRLVNTTKWCRYLQSQSIHYEQTCSFQNVVAQTNDENTVHRWTYSWWSNEGSSNETTTLDYNYGPQNSLSGSYTQENQTQSITANNIGCNFSVSRSQVS